MAALGMALACLAVKEVLVIVVYVKLYPGVITLM